MAQNEVVTVLKIETGQSENTIKGLKDEIKNLKQVLENTQIGSESFEKASKDLAEAQKELKTAMNETKQTVKDADGSYNALVATMAELKKEWRATADEVKRNELGQQIDNINSQLKELDASIGNNQRLVGSYAEEFKKALDEQNESILGTKTRLESVQKMASGLASGFAALQGVTALLGSENEDLAKVLVKVQSAMAIAQGVGGLKDLIEGASTAKVAFKGATMGVKSFIGGLSGVKKAIMATGIGALVIAVASLIAYWDDLVDLFGSSKEDIEKITGVVDDLKQSLETFDKDNNFIVKLAEAAGKSKEEILQLRYEQAKLAHQQAEQAESTAYSNYQRLEKEDWDWNGEGKEVTEAKKVYEEAKEIEKARYQAMKDILDEITIYEEEKRTEKRKKEQEDAEERKKKQQEEAKQKIEEEKRKQEELKKEATSIAEDARKALIDTKEEELAELERIYLKEKALLEQQGLAVDDLTAKYEKESKAIEEKYKKSSGAEAINELNKNLSTSNTNKQTAEQGVENKYEVKSLETNNTIDAIQLEIDKILELKSIREQAYNEQIAQIQDVLNKKELTVEQEEQLKDEIASIKQEQVENARQTEHTLLMLNKQRIKEEEQQEKLIANAKLDIASSVLGSLSSLWGEQSKVGKAFAVTQATIDTYKSANAAYASMVGIPVVGTTLAPIAAGAAILAGIANVKNILETSTDGKTTTLPSNINPSVTPNVNMVDNIPIQYTKELLTDTETSELNKGNRVYVVESDITETQDSVAIKESNSSF